MAQSNVGIRLSIDAAQAKGQVEDLSRVIADLNKQMKEAADAKDWKSVAQFSQAIDSASSGRGKLMAQANQAQAQQAQAQAKEGFFGGSGAWVLQNSLNQIVHGILGAWDAALTAAKQRASGDYSGSVVSQRRARGEIGGQAIGSAVGALGFIGGPILGMMMMGLGGEIGRFLGGIGSKKMEEALAWSNAYKNVLPSIDSLNQLYGGAINRKSGDENNRQGLSMHERAMGAARGTGLDTDDFIQAMTQMGKYGISSETQALNMTRQQALWSRFTGTDLGTIQKVAGQAKRYAGEDNALSIAYGGLKAQDMSKGQFGEFLNSLERVMADGISKGFTRSTEEIAGNMAMLYRLSGGSPLWQGEQGAQRLSQMNNAISNATNLQSVEDVISFGVARDIFNSLEEDNPETEVNEREEAFKAKYGKDAVYTGTYADEMQILERGVGKNGDLLQGQFEAVKRLEGGNVAAMIERYKTMYDLNYTGASQVWAMSERMGQEGYSAEEIAKEIKRFQETPGYRSDSNILQDLLNTVKNDGIKIGQIEFDNTELPAIREAAYEIWQLMKKETTDSNPIPLPSLPVPDIPNLPSAASQIPTSMGGGPAGTLQLFQGGQSYAAYMAGMPSQFTRNWDTLMNYNDRGERDYGDVVRNAVISAANGLDPSVIPEHVNIGFDNILANFDRLKGGGITAEEYSREFARQLEQLTNETDALKERNYGIKTGQIEFDNTELPATQTAAEEIRKILDEHLGIRPPDPREEALPQIVRDYNIPIQDITGRMTLPDGTERDANYYGPAWGTVNRGEGNYIAQWSRLVNDVTGGVSLDRSGIPEYYRYVGEYSRANEDRIIDTDELKQLIPALRDLARALGKENIFANRTDQEIHVYLTE